MRTISKSCGLVVLCWGLTAATALAQRVQFPTPVNSQPAASAAGASSVPIAPATPSLPAATQGTTIPPTTYSSPTGTIATPGNFAAPGVAAPGGTYPSPTMPYAPPTYGSTPPTAQPGATFNGNIQPPAAWDPYATSGPACSPLLSQDPYLQGSGPALGMTSMQKFIQHVDLDYDWFAGHGASALGINDVDLSVTFAIPMFANPQTPLLVTPGFAVHYWEGPVSVPPTPVDLPPRTYDGYLDFFWNPQIAPWFGAELNFRTGAYSDFNVVTTAALRFMGKGLGVVKLSEHMDLKAGIWYLDRNIVKILPAGGIVWKPNPDVYFNILFPDPRVGKKLTTWGNTEWWLVFSGEYGGGNWYITRNSGFAPPVVTDGEQERVDYNDIEIAVGLEFKTVRHLDGIVQVGGSFSRQLAYHQYGTLGGPLDQRFYPTNTVFVRAGLSY